MWQELLTSFLGEARKPLIVILGPTASGKTNFSLRVAQELRRHGRQAEIVNADSRQLYRHLDIGTAKIRSEEMQRIPHHLLSVLDPKEEVTIAWYKQRAVRVIREILARSNVPLLVGGSMLYLSAVIDGLEPLSPADPELRERLSCEYDRDGGELLAAKLESVDPEGAKQIHKQNRTYLVRALEIYELTGVPPSKQRRRTPCSFDLLILGIALPREELTVRIAQRTKAMLDGSWIEEVRRLLDRGYSVSDPGLKSQGYRAVVSFFGGKLTRERLEDEINRNVRQYAKRQMTWWHRDPRIHWISSEALKDTSLLSS
jgi:tRNA dimethylallyltransferase